MNATVLLAAYVFVLAVFLGIELIGKVPDTLHTPLMSGTNAIHGIVLIGAILVAGSMHDILGDVIGALAVFLGALNVVGGFVVTDRMLGMFRSRPTARTAERATEKETAASR